MPINITVIIPTLNAQLELPKLLKKIPTNENVEVIIIDSSSDDETIKIAKDFGAKVITVKREEFNHGGTRNIAAQKANGDTLIFLTQDALLQDEESIASLIKVFEDPEIAIAYGRQVPHNHAKVFGRLARKFNYPNTSIVKSLSDKENYGIKTVFTSNSFAAYRKDVFLAFDGFPRNVILGEDMYFGAKVILNGYKIAYVAEAVVLHSHDYSVKEEFQRNFDIGVFHQREKWILENFSSPEGEGIKFVLSEWRYLKKIKKVHLIPLSFVRNASKFLGYKLGRNHKKLPQRLVKRISMYKSFWNYNR